MKRRVYLFRSGWRLRLVAYPEGVHLPPGSQLRMHDGNWVRWLRLWGKR